ncbi:MAG: multiheme c-type cytochrome [Myxococcota bacterium]
MAIVGCDREETPAAELVPSGTAAQSQLKVDPDDPTSCRPCHAEVVSEWEQSMHSRSHEHRDPIFAGLRKLRIKVEGKEIARKCAGCHYPRDAAMTEPAVARKGVACASCHLVREIHRNRGPGARALVWSAGEMAGPHDGSASPVHGTHNPRFMEDGAELCLTCHNATKNPHRVAACSTGPEWEAGRGDACVSCHMPLVPGAAGRASSSRKTHRSHAFPGPHRAWYQDDPSFLAQAVKLDVQLDLDAVVVVVKNLTKHAFPSGFPGRMVTFVAVGRDATGHSVWSSAPRSAVVDTPAAVLRKVYVDAAGEPVPAPFATELKEDTRLKTGETRRIRLEAVPAQVQTVEVTMFFYLLPPPLAKKIGVEGIEAQPKPVLTVTAQR